ncbi:MAG: hypothetical protein ACJA02_001092 [Myxococcota bacterium]|jgi:hypothetical protein
MMVTNLENEDGKMVNKMVINLPIHFAKEPNLAQSAKNFFSIDQV